MNEITEKTIDIEKILHSKLGSKARYVPRLLVKWLKKIIHQDQVNAFIWEHRDESGVEWLESTVRYLKMEHGMLLLSQYCLFCPYTLYMRIWV